VNDFERVTQTPYKEKPRTPNGYAAQFYQFERKANTDPSLFQKSKGMGHISAPYRKAGLLP
jgi:hypothetical protein